MSDKPAAYLVTTAVVAPICSLCILGPLFIFPWLGRLFGSIDPLIATGATIFAMLVAYRFFKRRRERVSETRTVQAGPGEPIDPIWQRNHNVGSAAVKEARIRS